MFISAKAEYACQALIVLANRFELNRPVRLGDITKNHPIPSRFLVQILLQLKGAGIVTTTRGASGGYHLAKSPNDVTLYDVFQAIEGSEQSTLLREHSNRHDSGASNTSALYLTWLKIEQEYQNFMMKRAEILRNTTLAQLIASTQTEQYII